MSAMKLAATMQLNAGGFTNPLGKVRGLLGGTLGKLALLTGGVASMAGVMTGMRSALTFSADLDHLSKRAGDTAGNLAILRQAFDDTGVGADSAGELLNYMQRNLTQVDKNGATTNKGMKKLGLGLADMAGMGSVDQLNLIGQKIMAIQDPAKRTATAMDIFGRSGAKTIQYFAAGGAFDAAKASMGSLPGLLDANSARFESIDTYMGRLKGQWTGLFTGIMSGIAPQLDGVMAKIDKVDFAAWGVKIADAGKLAMAIFGSGRLGEIAGLGLKLGFMGALNTLISPLMSASLWKGIAQIALAGLMGLGVGLINLFTAPIVYLKAGLAKAFDELYEKLGKIPKLGKMMGLEGYEAKSFGQHLAESRQSSSFLNKASTDAAAAASDIFSGGMADLKKGLAGSDLYGTGEIRAQLAGVMAEVRAGMADAAPAVAAAAAQTTEGAGDGAGGGIAAGGAGKALSDQLTRIGGFMGGASPQARLAQEGNRLLTRIETGIRKLVTKSGDGGTFVPVWGA